ncbi:hypothetical protein BGX31_010954 [Mortierella sp. GBA43]|nr:hypothetical protein BGX31_010954 [Mortierella sp. GBA43]
MGSRSKSTSSKRTTTSSGPQKAHVETSPSIARSDHDVDSAKTGASEDMDMDTNHLTSEDEDEDEDDDSQVDEDVQDEGDDIDMQGGNRESSDEESDVEDDVDQELRENAVKAPKEAHTSDRIQRTLTNPEIEKAFHDQYMTQITQAFGDELNALRETDSLEGQHLELLIDSLNQTGHIYSAVEKALWVAGDGQR